MKSAPRLGGIFLTVFLDLLGFGLVLPFLAKEARDAFGVSAFVATLLGSVYSLMQFAVRPDLGPRVSTAWAAGRSSSGRSPGRRSRWPRSDAGSRGAAASLWLFAARIFGGIATANLGTASAYIADITKPEERAKGMGLIGAAFGLGFILGPGLGGALVADRNRRTARRGPLLRGCGAQRRQSRVGRLRARRVAAAREARATARGASSRR